MTTERNEMLALADEIEAQQGQDLLLMASERVLIVTALRGAAATPPTISQDGVRAVALAICKSRTCEGVSCCQWPANMGRVNCNAKSGAYDEAARAAIAALSPQLFDSTAQTSALKDVAAERQRQIEKEGWTSLHDDQHDTGEMARAAACYALSAGPEKVSDLSLIHKLWPWEWVWFKPRSKREDLVRSGALILAEIERLDRTTVSRPDRDGAA